MTDVPRVGDLLVYDVMWRGETHVSAWRVTAVDADGTVHVRNAGGMARCAEVRLDRKAGVGVGVLRRDMLPDAVI